MVVLDNPTISIDSTEADPKPAVGVSARHGSILYSCILTLFVCIDMHGRRIQI